MEIAYVNRTDMRSQNLHHHACVRSKRTECHSSRCRRRWIACIRLHQFLFVCSRLHPICQLGNGELAQSRCVVKLENNARCADWNTRSIEYNYGFHVIVSSVQLCHVCSNMVNQFHRFYHSLDGIWFGWRRRAIGWQQHCCDSFALKLERNHKNSIE